MKILRTKINIKDWIDEWICKVYSVEKRSEQFIGMNIYYLDGHHFLVVTDDSIATFSYAYSDSGNITTKFNDERKFNEIDDIAIYIENTFNAMHEQIIRLKKEKMREKIEKDLE